MRVSFDNYVIELCEDVYEPAEDSFTLLDAIDAIGLSPGTFADVGSGTGIVGIHASKKYRVKPIFIDINPKAVRCSKLNAELNGVEGSFILGDTLKPLRYVDYAAFNPPYLPGEPEDIVDKARSGGEEGIEEAVKFVKESVKVRKGAFLLLTAFNPVEKVIRLAESIGLHTRVLFTRTIAGERYYVIYLYTGEG